MINFIMILTLCCGSIPKNQPVMQPAITASQVFNTSMIGQTWTFQNTYGDHTFIEIESAPFCVFNICDGKSVTLYFTKDNTRAYFDPGHDSVLWFYIHLENDGSWRSLGFDMIRDGVSQSAYFTLLQGWTGTPYTIIPASSRSTAVNTAYQGNLESGLTTNITAVTSTWTSTWTTYAFTEITNTPFTGSVNALISKQCEGGTSGNCDGIQELWHFCPGVGLCAIEPIVGLDSNGNFIRLDPNLTLVRIN